MAMASYLEHPSHSKQILANATDRIGLLHWYCYDIGFGRQFTLGIRHSLSGLVHLAGALDINQADIKNSVNNDSASTDTN